MKDYKTLIETADPIEMEMLKNLLEEEGFDTYIADEYTSWLYSNSIMKPKIKVKKEDYSDALELIGKYRKSNQSDNKKE